MMIERKETSRRQAPSARPLVAIVVALFVVLQGLAAIGASLAHSSRGDGGTSFVTSFFGATCAADTHGGDRSPAPGRDHSQCCVLCGARNFDGASFHGVAQGAVAITLPSRVLVSIARRFDDAPDSPPIGWASSWSSQAPPFFS